MISTFVFFECDVTTTNILHSPYMLPNAEPTPYAIGEHVVASSSKLIVVDKILKDLLPKGERVLIFSVRLTAVYFEIEHSLIVILLLTFSQYSLLSVRWGARTDHE